MSNDPIKVGGPYKESDDHVPNPTDIVSQFNTEGVGAHNKIEEVSPIFTVDKVKTAQEILGALDPKDDTVSADRVLLPNTEQDNDAAKKAITETAKARVKQGVVIGEATPAEAEAALEGDEGTQAAVDSEAGNAAANSTGNRSAGQHSGDEDTSSKAQTDQPVGDSTSPKQTTAKKAAAKKP